MEGSEPDTPVHLRLYVAGETARAETATRLAQRLVEGTVHQLEVVDLFVDPAVAERERVLATPCLERVGPPPRRRVIGDLNDLDHVAELLGLTGLEI